MHCNIVVFDKIFKCFHDPGLKKKKMLLLPVHQGPSKTSPYSLHDPSIQGSWGNREPLGPKFQLYILCRFDIYIDLSIKMLNVLDTILHSTKARSNAAKFKCGYDSGSLTRPPGDRDL